MGLGEANVARCFAAPFLGEREAGAFVFVFLFQLGPGHERRVNGVEREVDEEGAVFVVGHEFAGLGGEPVFEVFAGRAVGQAGVTVGGEVLFPAVGAALVDATKVVIKALIFGPPTRGAEVPFAGEERGIAGGFQGFGERGRVEGEAVGVVGGEERGVAFPRGGLRGADVVGDAGALGPLAGEDAGARGGADGAGGVGIGEARALAGEAVEVRSLVERAAVAAEVLAAEVVGEEEDDVGRALRGCGGGRGCGGKGEGEEEGKREGEKEGKEAGVGHEEIKFLVGAGQALGRHARAAFDGAQDFF